MNEHQKDVKDAFELAIDVTDRDPKTACDIVSMRTGLSRQRVKHAMGCGAVWLESRRGKPRRIRRAKTALRTGDRITVYYDENLLNAIPPEARCLADNKFYSIWHKPAGLLTQGTRYGDHCSLKRQAERHFSPGRSIYIVHRLDREASGLILLAHDFRAAGKLSELFARRLVVKKYRIEVLGILSGKKKGAVIAPLDDKQAITEYEVKECRESTGTTILDVEMKTGRRHQIRRHFESIGHPVMGDPRYGAGNKNQEGMKLTALALQFRCPFSGKQLSFELDEEKRYLKMFESDCR